MKNDAHEARAKHDGIREVKRGGGRDRRGARAAAIVFLLVVAPVSWNLWGGRASVPATEDVPVAATGDDERPRRHAKARPAKPAAAAPAAAAQPVGLLDEETMERLVKGTPETAPERSAEENQKIEKTARELLDAAIAAGETTGIAAFPPPGTDPIKLGLVVPRDFELPEGFIRHHQITDDGRRLEPILMFSPDHEFVDADGKPIAVPESGIVPDDMAPAGMPLRVLAMPKNPYGPGTR